MGWRVGGESILRNPPAVDPLGKLAKVLRTPYCLRTF